MSQRFEYDVFVSYSREDKAVVWALAERLRGDGLKVWLDEWEIQPGDSIVQRMEEGLERSRVLLSMVSARGLDSRWAGLERYAVMFRDPEEGERRFIPVRLDDAKVPGLLGQFAFVDWRQREER